MVMSQTDYYLEGQVGKHKIFLTIQEYEKEIEASYFYQNSLKDILLSGTRSQDKFNFYFKEVQTNTVVEKFELTKLKNGEFRGFWINKKGKSIPVILKPIDFNVFKNKSTIVFENKLDVIKLKFLSFKQDSITFFNNKNITWYSEKHCNTPFFRLGNSFSEKNRNLINPILEDIQVKNVLSQLSCTSSFEYNTGNGIDYNVTIGYLNSNLLGFTIFSSWFCGGAHPDFGGTGYLIDLNTGKNYQIDEIIAFHKTATSHNNSNSDAFFAYRNDYFAPAIFSLIDETEKFVKPAEDSEDCDYTNLEVWNFVSWNYTQKGIEFTPSFYRAARNCEEPFLIPFQKLSSYKNKNFPYDLK